MYGAGSDRDPGTSSFADADLGKTVKVKVTSTDYEGNEEGMMSQQPSENPQTPPELTVPE